MANTLISKIAGASIKVGALATDKRNAQQGYDYISADKVLERAGDALAAAGVVIVPSIVSEVTEAVKTDKGGTRYDSIVHFGMIVTDGETQLEMPWCGRGSDYSVPDKAMYKAITSGHKYFLMKLLNVGVGNEDGEHESEPQQAPQRTQATPASKPTRNAPAAPQRPSTPATGKPAPVTDEQLEELNALGEVFYGDKWETQQVKLTEAVTKGAVSEVEKLLAQDAQKLIEGIQRKMAPVNLDNVAALPH